MINIYNMYMYMYMYINVYDKYILIHNLSIMYL